MLEWRTRKETGMAIKFDEKRYAAVMILRFEKSRVIAQKNGGDVEHFTNLIVEWQKYLSKL